MLFNTPEFILFFVPVALLVWILNIFCYIKSRNFFLLIASYIFYAKLNMLYPLLLIYVTAINYCGGRLLLGGKIKDSKAKTIIGFTISFTLLPLIFFKYAPAYINNIWLPVGLSFFSFQALTYTIDIYRKKIENEFSLINLSVFIAFFPTLLSGPIERARNIGPQLSNRVECNWRSILEGTQTFIWGLFKKVVVADRLAECVNSIYANYEFASGGTLALAAILYSFQIYYDFSGYASMAVGVGKILGFRIMGNFNFPYFASSIKDFWRRWHISLTSWFTEYVYISLGGNRVSIKRWILNISAIFFLSGVWHGAAWGFVIWGAMHGVLYLLEYFSRIKDKSALYRIFVFIAVTITWIFFRTGEWRMAAAIIGKIFSGPWLPIHHGAKLAPIAAATLSMLILAIACELLLFFNKVPRYWLWKCMGMACLIILISLFAVNNDQFVYFKF